MKFLIDAQLPPSLVHLFKRMGFEAIHTLDLPKKNLTSDKEIAQFASRENWIVVSKDSDFFDSCILRNSPPKLVMVKTGNIGVGKLTALFEKGFDNMLKSLENNKVVSIEREI